MPNFNYCSHSVHRTNQRGFSYAEVLLSVILLAILLVPAMQALNSAIAGGSSNVAALQLNLRNKMEEVLSNTYNKLYADTSLSGGNTTTSVSTNYSDTAGATNRRVVVLYRFDTTANALSATDTGVLYVSVYYEAEGSTSSINTLVGRWW